MMCRHVSQRSLCTSLPRTACRGKRLRNKAQTCSERRASACSRIVVIAGETRQLRPAKFGSVNDNAPRFTGFTRPPSVADQRTEKCTDQDDAARIPHPLQRYRIVCGHAEQAQGSHVLHVKRTPAWWRLLVVCSLHNTTLGRPNGNLARYREVGSREVCTPSTRYAHDFGVSKIEDPPVDLKQTHARLLRDFQCVEASPAANAASSNDNDHDDEVW